MTVLRKPTVHPVDPYRPSLCFWLHRTHIRDTVTQPMQREHLLCFARCSLCVYRLSSMGFILFVRVSPQCTSTSARTWDDICDRRGFEMSWQQSRSSGECDWCNDKSPRCIVHQCVSREKKAAEAIIWVFLSPDPLAKLIQKLKEGISFLVLINV